jgi:enoyl-CoA hydratase
LALADNMSIRKEGAVGRITLTRPRSLNALSYEMCLAIEKALLDWRADDAVELVMIDAEGEKAFCAGGDIEDLYNSGKRGDFDYGRRFWADEYRLNALIAGYEKPYVAFLQGWTMGGGVGIGCHGNFRVVCENSQIAMPECGIGLVPDVGGSILLAHAPGRLGEYLGLTGARMNAADAILCDFADSFVPFADWERLKAEIIDLADPDVVDDFALEPPPSRLEALVEATETIFRPSSLLKCIENLASQGEEWASDAIKAMRRNCPLSVACAFEIIRKARDFKTVEQALDMEYRFTSRSLSHGEFIEGIRAQIIDKDRKPNWRVPRIEDVTAGMVSEMLAIVPGGRRAHESPA